MIKVLHISNTYKAGSPIRIVQCLNKYSDNKIKCNLITLGDFKNNKRLGNLKYDIDYLYNKNDINIYQKLFDEADIIHCHYEANTNVIPDRNLLNKKCIFHHHNFVKNIKNDFYCKKLVVGQYQPRIHPDALIVPNIIDIYDDILMPVKEKYDKTTIFFSYSNTSEKEGTWNDKGVRYIKPILEKIKNNNKNIDIKIYTNKPYKELMQIKQKCHISIDDIMNKSFHLTALEAASQGLITITAIDEQTKIVIDYFINNKEIINNELPFYNVNRLNLELTLLDIINSNKIEVLQKYARIWMEKYWSPQKMIKYYIDIYENIKYGNEIQYCKTFNELKNNMEG